MRRQPVETDFKVEVSADAIAVLFLPTMSRYNFARFASERDVAEFGPLSPDPAVQHASRASGARDYASAEVQAMAFRLATAAMRPDA